MSNVGTYLDPRCHVLGLPSGLLLCRGTVRLHVSDSDQAGLVARLIEMLDGRPIESILEGLSAIDKFSALAILHELQEAGLLFSDERAFEARLSTCALQSPQIATVDRGLAAGSSVGLLGRGHTADTVAALLTAAHLTDLRRVCNPQQPGTASVWVVAVDEPDLTLIGQVNRHACGAGQATIYAFPFGDELFVFPMLHPGQSACAHCLFSRWLGMSPAIARERALFDHLESGGCQRERLPRPAASWLAAAAAQHTVEWLNGQITEQRLVTGDSTTGDITKRAVSAHPWCAVCRPRPTPHSASRARQMWNPRHLARDRTLPLPALLEQLSPLCDDRVGLVGDVHSKVLESAPGVATAIARFAIPQPEQVAGDQSNISCGIAADARTAEWISCIEGLERYCMLFPDEPAVVAPYRSVRDDALHPATLPLYSAAQYRLPEFPYMEFSEETSLSWVWGYDLTDDREILVPGDAVSGDGPRSSQLFHTNSSGIAAHSTRADAMLSAILELVERDSFMIAWLHRLSLPRLSLAQLPAGMPEMTMSALHDAGYQPMLIDMTTDLGIPVVLALASRTDVRHPALLVGAGCGLTPRRALHKALAELNGALHGCLQATDWQLPPPLAVEDVRRLHDHGAAYAHPSWLDKAGFLWQSNDQRSVDDMRAVPGASEDDERPRAARLAVLVQHLRAHGLNAIAADITTPDIEPHGLRVVRAIVPGLQPIGFGRHGVRLGGRRLYEAPERMGYPGRQESHLNPDPHCFP